MENRKDFSLKEIYRRETFSEMSQFQCEFRTLISVLVCADLWKPLIILPNWLDASTLAPFTRFRYSTSKCDRRNWKSRNRVETKSSCENPKNFSHIMNPCEKNPRREFNPVTAWKSSESSFQSASASRFFGEGDSTTKEESWIGRMWN